MEKILILNFGGKYSRIVARKVRECSVFSEIMPYTISAEEINAEEYKGIILVGDDDRDMPESFDGEIFRLSIPMLGIGFGARFITDALGGKSAPAARESGKVALVVDNTCSLFEDLISKTECYINHERTITRVPTGFRITAKTEKTPVAAAENAARKLYAVAFHPELSETAQGIEVFKNFLYRICGCHTEWTPAAIVRKKTAELEELLGDRKVLLPLSGGVASATAAMLTHKVIGDRLTCIIIDNGLMRKDELAGIKAMFGDTHGLNIKTVSAEPRFFGKLIGITEPAAKRKIASEELARVFFEEAKKETGDHCVVLADFLPDGDKLSIPAFPSAEEELVFPLRDLFFDEVRAIAGELGLPEAFAARQHFPIEGLAAKVIGEVTEQKLSLLREADAIFREEIINARIPIGGALFFASLLDTKEPTFALRAVKSNDFGEHFSARLPYELLERVSGRIKASIPNSHVVFDITDSPERAEWE